MVSAELTILNSMASVDFDQAVAIHKEWNLNWTDLRDNIWGKRVEELTVEEAIRAHETLAEVGLGVACLSTGIFFEDVRRGPEIFREHLDRVPQVLGVADELQPRMIRLIAGQLPALERGRSATEALREEFPWVIDTYREAIDLIEERGHRATIENEAFECFLSDTDDFLRFFEWLDRPNVKLTWDINNQWATGRFPTISDYDSLREIVGYFHLKGGQAATGSSKLAWNCALEDSDYDVREITQRVVDDGTSPVICLNPSQHGDAKPSYDYSRLAQRDLTYLRGSVRGLL